MDLDAVTDQEIQSLLNEYLGESGAGGGRGPNDRLASFDYCYNYFHSFYEQNRISQLGNERYMQTSCLQLGFYLASWGMLRGSTDLLQRSVRHLQKVITEISKTRPELWKIDVDKYTPENIQILLGCKSRIADALRSKDVEPSNTLVTKVMLGVFCNIPAFDTNFVSCFGFRRNESALENIQRFYLEHRDVFDDFHVTTLDFSTGKPTSLVYPKVKLVDMFGWIKGGKKLD